MKIEVIAFSREGGRLLVSLIKGLREQGDVCVGFLPEKYREPAREEGLVHSLTVSAGEWTKEHFTEADGLIFIGAAGIAVRSAAPYLTDKYTDPAIIVVDDGGNYAISLLSGHAGRANQLARRAARILDAIPVITTASDIHGICAVDEWAAGLGLTLTDRTLAKEMAAAVIDGEPIGFWEDPVCRGFCDFRAQSASFPARPDGCQSGTENDYTVCVTPRTDREAAGKELRLIPRCVAVGIGCRKGIKAETVTDLIRRVLEREHYSERAIFCIASIDLKAREGGIVEAAKAFSVPFLTFPAAFLDAIPGPFSESQFVREVTGTGNVCERAAFAAAVSKDGRLPGRLLMPKYAEDGVTVALAAPVYQG